MANLFAEYSPEVPLGTTWEEQMLFVDEDGNPVDLSGYTEAHAQLRVEKFPVVSGGAPTTDPVLELTTPDAYGTPPAWPVTTRRSPCQIACAAVSSCSAAAGRRRTIDSTRRNACAIACMLRPSCTMPMRGV